MTLLVPLVLVVMWAAVLLPPYLRSRQETRLGSVGAYRRQLSALDRGPRGHRAANPGFTPLVRPGRAGVPGGALGPLGGPSWSRPMTLRQAQKRRRDIISALLGVASVTLLLGGGVSFLRPLLVVHGLVDVLLVAYVGLLMNARQVHIERETKVHYLPGARRPAAAAGEPLLLLQRVGG